MVPRLGGTRRAAVNDPDTRLAHVEYAAAEDVDPATPRRGRLHPGYPSHITHEAMESALEVFALTNSGAPTATNGPPLRCRGVVIGAT